MKDFVHCHVHSDYSLQDGITKVEELIAKAANLKMPAIALTDHGYLHGAIDFYKEAKKANIKPIIGVEAYLTAGNAFDKNTTPENLFHLTLLCKNKEGYKNLLKLMTIAATDCFYYKPVIDKNLLREYSAGLICLSGCMEGESNVNLYTGSKRNNVPDLDKAKDIIDQYRDIFKNDFYMELMYHGVPAQKELVHNSIKIINELGLQAVVTNDAHYANKNQGKLRDIVLADRTHQCINDPARKLKDVENEFYLKTRQELELIWANHLKYLDSSLEINEKISDYDPGLMDGFRLPKIGTDSSKIFIEKLVKGFKEKYPDKKKDSEEYFRLEHETKVIQQLGFTDYFLILEDLVRYADKNNIPVGPGRGSAAGSIISYCLDITSLDPIKYDLLFERFLNAGRKSLPDIDIDVCKERRNDLISYIKNKYGNDSVAQIITFGRMKGKLSLRSIGKVLSIDEEEVDDLAMSMPNDAQEFTISLKQIVNGDPEAPRSIVSKINSYTRDPVRKNYIDSCVALEGIYRSSGVHAAGIVIGPEPLNNIIPLCKAKDGSYVTQFSMEEIDDVKLVKFDLLGLDTLTVIQNCLNLINNNKLGVVYDEAITTPRKLVSYLGNFDDKLVYEKVFSRGDTIGIFQCDSSGIRQLLCEMNCSSFEDICAAISLYRPGPMDSGIMDSFIKRRNKLEEEDIWHESIKPYVKHTHGLPIYQEQIMFIARELCGFSLLEADDLRKIIGKKKKEDIQKFRQKFVPAAVKTSGITEDKANKIYDDLESFGRYGFNRSHAAAYAVICYTTGWLKTYYPVEFMTSLLNKFVVSEIDKGEDTKVIKKKDDELFSIYLWETQCLGINVLSPSISRSNIDFQIVDRANISYGLGAVKGIGTKIAELVSLREKSKGFLNFAHFIYLCLKSGLTARAIKDLYSSNCIDIPISADEFTKYIEGYQRNCRCVKDSVPKESCKLCLGLGKAKTLKTIMDDIKSFIKEPHTEDQLKLFLSSFTFTQPNANLSVFNESPPLFFTNNYFTST